MKQSISEHKETLAHLKEFIRKEKLYLKILNDRSDQAERDYAVYSKQIATAENQGTLKFDRNTYLIR